MSYIFCCHQQCKNDPRGCGQNPGLKPGVKHHVFTRRPIKGSKVLYQIEKRLYICEFKVIGKSDSVKGKLEEAKAQIREKRYGIRLSDKEVITLAVIIINENKDDKPEAMREVAAIADIGN